MFAKLFFLMTFVTFGPVTADEEYQHLVHLRCKPIVFEACKDVGYNVTAMPNLVGLELDSEAEYSLSTFRPLVNFGCSSQLQFLLCSLYAPMCTPKVPTLIGPCRPLCEGVRDRCEPVLRGFGYPWPSALNCTKLPSENNELHMCMEGPEETVPLPPPPLPPPPRQAQSFCVHLAQPQLYVFLNATGRCAPLCGAHITFSGDSKTYAGVWLSIWALATFVIGIFILCSLLLDANLLKYPDRAASHMCLCYTLIATGYIVRLVGGGRSVSCRKDPELGVFVAITEGSLSTPCVVVFLLLYYFTMAAGVWWVIHNLCWFLKAWRGLCHEHFLHFSSLLHTVGWGAPSALTIACLLLKKVEADELTGTCFAGGQGPESMVRWVIVPQFLFLIIGATFLVLSFSCFWRSRSALAQKDSNHAHIEVSVARIGVMGVLYMVPATCMLGSYFYELSGRDLWIHEIGVRPHVEVFMLKIFMSLSPGLFLGMFLINSKVLSAWMRFLRRLLTSKRPPPPYLRGPTFMGISTDKNVPHGTLVAHLSPQTSLVTACPTHGGVKVSKKKYIPKKQPETVI